MENEDAFQEWGCKHVQTWRLCKPPEGFECDACGLLYSAPPPRSFQITLFRENCLRCEQCGLFVHEKCLDTVLSPSLCLFAKTRIRERKSRLVFQNLILPELKQQHDLLLQRGKAVELELKQLSVKLEEALWNRGWALKTFCNLFYQESNPERLENAQFLPNIMSVYAKSTPRFRAFFDKLVETYPLRAADVRAQLARFEEEMLQSQDAEMARFEAKEAELEKLVADRDELFREIHFPMASVLNPPWRLRFSVQDYIVVAIGDFHLERLQCKLRILGACKDEASFVVVEMSGYDSKIASISAAIDRFALFGTSLPISTYSATSLDFSFEFSLRVKADFTIGKRWVVNKEETRVEIFNFRHHLLGASFPLPSRVLDLVVNTVFASQVKQAVLELLPQELGEYLQRLGEAESFDMEFRICTDTLMGNKFLHQSIQALDFSRLVGLEGIEPSHLQQVCIALSPRQTKTEEWTFAKLLELYTRFFAGEAERWGGVWRLYGFPLSAKLFAYLQHVDNKPMSLQMEFVHFKLAFRVKEMLRMTRDVIVRVYDKNKGEGGGGGGAFDMRGGGGGSDKRRRAPSATAAPAKTSSATATRAVVTEMCNSAEHFVHSVLSHAVKELAFTLQFTNAEATSTTALPPQCKLAIGPLSMISSLVDNNFSAQVMTLATSASALPECWTQTLAVDAETGAIELGFARQNSDANLFARLCKLQVRLICDTPSIVAIKLGYLQGAELETRGGPRIETELERASLLGGFASYITMLRDLRNNSQDEVDALLQRLEQGLAAADVLHKLVFDLELRFQAHAMEGNDLHVRICFERGTYQDEIELIPLFADLHAIVMGGT